jgi:S-adenosylmethionine:tRNA ribosyltransferase-isomerase
MNISDFDYDLPDGRIARFPLEERDASKLLVWRNGDISETSFGAVGNELPAGSLLVFNNTRVVRARLVMYKAAGTAGGGASKTEVTRGARIEILCLEPTDPADYERAFAAKGSCEWLCMVGNLKKWGGTTVAITDGDGRTVLRAWRKNPEHGGAEQIVRFEWSADLTFGELLERLGRMPIPPYLGRDSEEMDNTRYQTVFARVEGSVAAPTAGLHFTPELIAELTNPRKIKEGNEFFVKSATMQRPRKICEGSLPGVNDRANFERKDAASCFSRKIETEEVTLHVGAGTFLPVKVENALEHPMHTEHFEVMLAAIEHILAAMEADGELSRKSRVIAVGTTSVRTLESLAALGWRIRQSGGPETGNPDTERTIGQFELYDIPAEFDGRTALETLAAWMRIRGLDRLRASTQIMITPGFCFRVTGGIITNFHQPKSTLLLLIAAFTGRNANGGSSANCHPTEEWRRIYDYALAHDFRFLSYGDSSLLLT